MQTGGPLLTIVATCVMPFIWALPTVRGGAVLVGAEESQRVGASRGLCMQGLLTAEMSSMIDDNGGCTRTSRILPQNRRYA